MVSPGHRSWSLKTSNGWEGVPEDTEGSGCGCPGRTTRASSLPKGTLSATADPDAWEVGAGEAEGCVPHLRATSASGTQGKYPFL